MRRWGGSRRKRRDELVASFRLDVFTYIASDGTLTDTVTVIVYVYLPLILRHSVAASDLAVERVTTATAREVVNAER